MYIKLTRLDGTPIWINAAFVVTVEPRKLGGATVVPIGDGLDYDVRETADMVLDMLDAAPVEKVVPVPVPKSLTQTPDDVSPEDEPTAPREEKRGENREEKRHERHDEKREEENAQGGVNREGEGEAKRKRPRRRRRH